MPSIGSQGPNACDSFGDGIDSEESLELPNLVVSASGTIVGLSNSINDRLIAIENSGSKGRAGETSLEQLVDGELSILTPSLLVDDRRVILKSNGKDKVVTFHAIP